MEWYNDNSSIVGLRDQAQPQPPVTGIGTMEPNQPNSLAHWMVPNPNQEIPEHPNIESQSDDDDDAGDSDSSEYVPSDSEPEQEDETYVVQPISPKSPSQKKRGRPSGPKNVNSNRGGGGANGTDNTCKICNKSFTAYSSLQRHEATTHSENNKRFSCEHCGMKFTQKPSLVTHVKNKHLGKFDYPCPHCEKKFGKNSTLQNHIRLRHPDPNEIGSNLQKCPECGKEVMHLKAHLICHSTIQHPQSHESTQYKCDICGKMVRRKADLLRHMKLHSTPLLKPFSCPHCPQKFKRAYCVPEHIRKSHLVERNFESKYCDTKFLNRNTRNRHDENHRLKGICVKYKGKRIFACEYCEERTESEYLLKTHMKKKHPKLRLVLQKMKAKDISLKENPKSGLFLVRGDKEQQGKDSGSGQPWYLCLNCGHAFLDLNKARRHNNFCEVVPESLAPAENQDIEPETSTTTGDNDMDVSEPEHTIPNIDLDLDPDPPVTSTLSDKPQRIVIEPEIINSDDDEPMDYFDEAFGEDEVTDIIESNIDEGDQPVVPTSSKTSRENTAEDTDTVGYDLIEDSDERDLEEEPEDEPVSVTVKTTKPPEATPAPAPQPIQTPSVRQRFPPTNSKLPSALRATTPWQMEHMNVVLTAPKPFQCKTCLKFFSTKGSVWSHVRAHHEEPKHCCEFCGQRFGLITVYQNHVRTHTGEKPYKCRFCDYRSGAHSAIYVHERIHPESGRGAPFRYGGKPQEEGQGQGHKNHYQRRITEYQKKNTTCTVCNKTFGFVKDCQNHMYFAHEKDPSKGLPFTCTICKSTFAYKSNTVSHIRSLHSEEVKKVGANNCASILTNFILLDESLLPPKKAGPRGRFSVRGDQFEIPDNNVDDEDSNFQDLSAVITKK